ncbi:MAG TPA: lipid asymmetry maintenance ABC transporter permease subunit MlaE [Candidatus Azoamicus sp. OHIO1]
MIYSIINKIECLGKASLKFMITIGKAGLLIKSIITGNVILKRNIKQFIRHLYFIGVLSMGIIIISGLFIGMVVGLQGYYILKKFGAEQVIGQMTVLTIIRELGPVISALLFAGRTGASLTAEIGLMECTEQLSSMEMMGIDPIKKVIAPRFWAGLIAMILLALIFIVIAIIGSYISTVHWLNVDSNSFWSSIQENVNFKVDIINSIIKSTIFGFIITWISVFQGITCKPTAEGIAISTTNTVVYSSFTILGLNFFLTAIMFKWN